MLRQRRVAHFKQQKAPAVQRQILEKAPFRREKRKERYGFVFFCFFLKGLLLKAMICLWLFFLESRDILFSLLFLIFCFVWIHFDWKTLGPGGRNGSNTSPGCQLVTDGTPQVPSQVPVFRFCESELNIQIASNYILFQMQQLSSLPFAGDGWICRSASWRLKLRERPGVCRRSRILPLLSGSTSSRRGWAASAV